MLKLNIYYIYMCYKEKSNYKQKNRFYLLMRVKKQLLYDNIINDISYSLKQILDETIGSLYLNAKEKTVIDNIFNDIETEKYKEAVSILTEALKYNPTSFELNYELGMAYTMLNDFQNAKLYYEKAAELNSLVYNTKYSLFLRLK